jgi:hypothetical protein
MANLAGLAGIVSELRVERTNLVDRLRHVDAALSVLGKLGGGSNYTKPKRGVSASARKRMSLAQKARWAKAKGRAPKPQRLIIKVRGKDPKPQRLIIKVRGKDPKPQRLIISEAGKKKRIAAVTLVPIYSKGRSSVSRPHD